MVHRDVLGHAVHYDKDRNLWFADVDVEINDDQKYFPFVRLALVRHQPQSAPGCQISAVVVTDPIQLPPMRTLTASAEAPNPQGVSGIKVTVTGPWMNNSVFVANLHSRVPDPLLGFSGSASEISTLVSGSHRVLTSSVIENTITATGVVLTKINGVPLDVPAAQLVVHELQRGHSLHFAGEPSDPTGPTNRPVYVESVDEAQLRPAKTL